METSDEKFGISREEIKNVSEKDSAFGAAPMKLCTVLQILQEPDQLVQKKRPSIASSMEEGRNSIGLLHDASRDKSGGNEDSSGSQLQDGRESGGEVEGYLEKTRRHMKDNILCRDNRWYIPPGLLRAELLRQNHDDPNAGHFGYSRTLELIQRKYYWPEMVKNIKHYVETCTRYHQVKSSRYKPFGLLESLPVPKGPRQNWTMDFITDLSPSLRRTVAYDAILVMVDRYTKYSPYIPARKVWNAEIMADVLVEEIFTKFGMPVSIVSDRGSLFTSKYWSHFCYHLRNRLSYSTAFHPQTDGQTERQNQTLEHYLRCYVNY